MADGLHCRKAWTRLLLFACLLIMSAASVHLVSPLAACDQLQNKKIAHQLRIPITYTCRNEQDAAESSASGSWQLSYGVAAANITKASRLIKQAYAEGLPRCCTMHQQVSAQAQEPDQSTPGLEPTNSTLRGLLIRIKPDDNPKAPSDGIPARIKAITDVIIAKAWIRRPLMCYTFRLDYAAPSVLKDTSFLCAAWHMQLSLDS
jgi:hypothetical protein